MTARLAIIAGVLAASAIAHAGSDVRHLPPAEARAGEDLALVADVSRGWETSLSLRFRAVGQTEYSTVAFARGDDDTYTATIPGTAVTQPGLEYFIAGTGEGGDAVTYFASQDAPHRVLVFPDDDQLRVEREVARLRGRRARLSTSFDYVDYGARTVGGQRIDDNYTRIDVDFSYRILRFPLYSMRFGVTRLLGTTPEDDGTEIEAGFRAGGWVELGFRIWRGIDIDARGMVVANQAGFGVGGRGELRIGSVDKAHVALGTELIPEVGSMFFFRLGWDTVPQLPMTATVEVTEFPSSTRPRAVRLVYGVAYPFDNGLRWGIRAGYQARDNDIGGVTGGTSLALDF